MLLAWSFQPFGKPNVRLFFGVLLPKVVKAILILGYGFLFFAEKYAIFAVFATRRVGPVIRAAGGSQRIKNCKFVMFNLKFGMDPDIDAVTIKLSDF